MEEIKNKEQNKIKDKFNIFLKSGKVPHILLYGNYGSGKRSMLKYLIDKLYIDVKNKEEYIININCSEFKGIKFIREDLKFFGKKQIYSHDNKIFKSIILFNSEFLTIDAQSSLRRLIEIYSNNTRFFMITNNINKIISPIISRFCVIYVPSLQIKNKSINFHEYKNQQIIDLSKNNTLEKKYIKSKIDKINNNTNNLDLLNLSKEFYKKTINIDNLNEVIIKNIQKKNDFEKMQEYEKNIFLLKNMYKEVRNDIFIIYNILCFFRFKYDFSI